MSDPRPRQPTDRTMRSVLWAGVVYNAMIAVLLAFPVALAPISGLPAPGSLFYPWILALFVAVLLANRSTISTL